MFHLLVKYTGWSGGRDTLPADRIYKYTDPDLIQLATTAGGLKWPALFLSEVGGKGSQKARIGTIAATYEGGSQLTIEYGFDETIPPISNQSLVKIGTSLGIEEFEFRHTHWAIKRADLYKSLVQQQLKPVTCPTVFNLDAFDEIDEHALSVMMPFDSRMDAVYHCIEGVAERLRMECFRADNVWNHSAVVQDIVSLISQARVVVCDCTGRNANVFYEIGVAHTLGRDVILITQSHDDIPFDLKHLRYIPYLNNAQGLQQLAEQLCSRVDTLRTKART